MQKLLTRGNVVLTFKWESFDEMWFTLMNGKGGVGEEARGQKWGLHFGILKFKNMMTKII
jgi:hypothetical protein